MKIQGKMSYLFYTTLVLFNGGYRPFKGPELAYFITLSYRWVYPPTCARAVTR